MHFVKQPDRHSCIFLHAEKQQGNFVIANARRGRIFCGLAGCDFFPHRVLHPIPQAGIAARETNAF